MGHFDSLIDEIERRPPGYTEKIMVWKKRPSQLAKALPALNAAVASAKPTQQALMKSMSVGRTASKPVGASSIGSTSASIAVWRPQTLRPTKSRSWMSI